MGVKKLLYKIGDKAANKISDLSVLSSDQIEQINNNREEYLSKIPDPSDTNEVEISNRLLAASSVEIFDLYLSQIQELYRPVDNMVELGGSFDSAHNIRYINITKWVTDKNENSLEKLVNVYDVLSKETCNIALVFNRQTDKTKVYLATVNTANAHDNTNSEIYRMRIEEAIRGNFPGSEWNPQIGKGRIPCLDNDRNYSVATATNIPDEKSEKFISQTIEKLLDGIVPDSENKEYTMILLATPINDVHERKMRLSEFYSGLSPYSSWQTNYTFTEAKSNTSMATFGVNIGTSAGSQQTQSLADTKSKAETLSESRSVSDSIGGGVNAGIGSENGPNLGVSANYNHTVSNSLGKALSTVLATTKAVAEGTTNALNLGASFSRASNVTATVGMNEGITQSYVNFNIKHTLDVLEKQMERYETSTALGMWDFSVYVVSENPSVANNVAHTYLALTQGEESYLSNAAVNLWRGDLGEASSGAKEICKYIRDLRHPVFALDPDVLNRDDSFYVYPPIVTATTALSGKELAYSLNFPRKSISGFPVFQCAEFGRDIVTYDSTKEKGSVKLGKIFHMNHTENTDVTLEKRSFASHVFITGSTGSGKSNTTYRLLEELSSQNIRFMVIEPAKGEYKNIFGNRKDVSVFGTNPMISDLLRINPFSFPEGIHVYEHMDRLVELFNVCWPMYAAMPAVLKNAVEKSYEDCGWDLISSVNTYDSDYFPTFADVTRNVRKIIDSSEYNSENKGAYKGSLLTRLQSLTNGINGLVFTSEELDSNELFDSNVIVDLSRVGSAETKSLLMGMLVMKLQEHRIACSKGMNLDLNHITILEEAHNLLKRTSTEQSSEGSNLMGKSVEMISNAIAEMRTYGEGFVIVDQSPGLIDMSAIRNTNTKIIMRLPDNSDRILVGKAANLNDDQIEELSKLPCGVAAVFQNEWIQPVLCKVGRSEHVEETYTYSKPADHLSSDHIVERLSIADMLSKGMKIERDISKEEMCSKMDMCSLSASLQVRILRYMGNSSDAVHMRVLGNIMYELFPELGIKVKNNIEDGTVVEEWTKDVNEEIRSYAVNDQLRRDIVQGIITHYLVNENNNIEMLKLWRDKGGLR